MGIVSPFCPLPSLLLFFPFLIFFPSCLFTRVPLFCLRVLYLCIMVFTAPNWVDPLPAIPDNIPISEFMLNEQYGRYPVKDSRDPFTCGFTGKSYGATEVVQRVDSMARGLAKELGWEVNKGTEWDKVLGIFSYNTVCPAPYSFRLFSRKQQS